MALPMPFKQNLNLVHSCRWPCPASGDWSLRPSPGSCPWSPPGSQPLCSSPKGAKLSLPWGLCFCCSGSLEGSAQGSELGSDVTSSEKPPLMTPPTLPPHPHACHTLPILLSCGTDQGLCSLSLSAIRIESPQKQGSGIPEPRRVLGT